VIRSCECVCVPARKAFPGAVRKINQNRFKSTTSVADLPMSVCVSVCACVCHWACGCVYCENVTNLFVFMPSCVFYCLSFCCCHCRFVAFIRVHFPFPPFHPFSSHPPKKRGITLHASVFCFHTHIWSIFNNGIEAQTPAHHTHTHKQALNAFTIGFLCFF